MRPNSPFCRGCALAHDSARTQVHVELSLTGLRTSVGYDKLHAHVKAGEKSEAVSYKGSKGTPPLVRQRLGVVHAVAGIDGNAQVRHPDSPPEAATPPEVQQSSSEIRRPSSRRREEGLRGEPDRTVRTSPAGSSARSWYISM